MGDALLASLACPYEQAPGTFFGVLAVEYAREFTRRLLELHGPRLESGAPGLAAVFERWLASDAAYDAYDFETCWDLPFADLKKAVSHRESDPLPGAVAWGLWLNWRGIPGEWRSEFTTARRLRCGTVALPEADAIEVDATPASVAVKLWSGRNRSEVRARGDSRGDVEGATILPVCHMDGVRFAILSAGVPGTEDMPPRAEISDGEIVALCHDALSFLHQYAPIYVPWVGRVVRAIVPIFSEKAKIRSGSSFEEPGVLQISFPARPAAIAEMLVHEASHQYFQLGRRLGPVDDGSDETLYYSPVRDMGRPLRFILLAFHAFANVLLYYRECRAAQAPDDGYCLRNDSILVPQLGQLVAPLRQNRALTPLGNSLWEPLAQRIA